jgi:hypothetical protein
MRAKAKAKAIRLAESVGATIDQGGDELEAELPAGKVWDHSSTRTLIASRESGETMDDVWADLLYQMEFGIILGVTGGAAD